jgi:hypothetical protein
MKDPKGKIGLTFQLPAFSEALTGKFILFTVQVIQKLPYRAIVCDINFESCP